MTRLGIYGGTFSPPHLGHIASAKAFLDTMQLDRLLIIPTAIPPHKSVSDFPADHHRLELCRLAFGDLPSTEISDLEIKRGGKSYTYLTLRELTARDQQILFLCGTDMLLTLDTWRNADEVMRLATFVAISRESDDAVLRSMEEKRKVLARDYGADISILRVPPVPASSTEIREAIGKNLDTSRFLSPSVAAYIKKWSLYR